MGLTWTPQGHPLDVLPKAAIISILLLLDVFHISPHRELPQSYLAEHEGKKPNNPLVTDISVSDGE